MTAPTYVELATALSYVLERWKSAGASPIDAKPFDDLVERLMDEPAQTGSPPASEPEPVGQLNVSCEVPPPRRVSSRDMSDKLAILDAEIDAANRDAD